MHPDPTPHARYASLAQHFAGDAGVVLAERNGFGSRALCVNDRIFAMLTRGRLVVKLPRPRVDALLAAGHGERLDMGNGRVMKEWLSLHPASPAEWAPLAREALGFVGGGRP